MKMKTSMALMVGLGSMCGIAAAQGDTLSPGDQQFLRQAYSINEGEVELGFLAVARGTTDQVRDFGQRMIDDHSLALTELRELARKGSFSVPDQLLPAQQQLYREMSKLSGTAFDRGYLEHMVSGHEGAIATFSAEASLGQERMLKDYATKELSMLKSHESIAQFDVEHPRL